jgi:hypothetical protein
MNTKRQTAAAACLLHAIQMALMWLACCCSLASITRTDGAMNLPDGIENMLGFVPRSSFKCERDGYFGDIDNDCRLFHLCQSQLGPGGRVEWRHWTYACGNQTMFNQLTLTCAFVDEAIPCRHASQFQYLNEVIHKPAEPFLTDADVTSGFSYYSNRIMSDGARQRAFEDSQLLAQIGGSASGPVGQAQPASATQLIHHKKLQPATHPSQFDSRLPTHGFRSAAASATGTPDDQLHQAIQWSVGNLVAAAHQDGHRLASAQDQSQVVDLIQGHSLRGDQFQPAGHQFGFGTTAGALQTVSDNQRRAHQSEIAAASSDDRQTSSAGSVAAAPVPSGSARSNNNNFQQQPAQNSQFEFAITTDHQANAPSEPVNVIFRQQQQQQQQQFGAATSASSEPTTSTTTAATSTTTAENKFQTTSPSQPTSSSAGGGTTPSSASLVPTLASSQRLQFAQATALVAPTTSTTVQPERQEVVVANNTTQAPAPTPPTSVEPQRPKNRRPSGASQQVSPHSGRGGSATTTGHNSSGRLQRAGFQSSRLSGQQAAHNRRNTEPIVMRKSQRSAGAQQSAAGSSASTSDASSRVQALAPATASWSPPSSDFWRRSFDSQLMAPKFESLLLRRRV